MKTDITVDKLFKILGHPTRLAILEILRSGDHCVCHIEAILNQRQASISQQLMILRDAGLVEDQQDGRNVYYRVVKSDLYHLIDAAYPFLGIDPGRLQPAANCPCPKCNQEKTNQ